MKELEKNSAVPLYYQLYSHILEEIRSGALKPGDMIPPETSLMEMYGVSRATVRHAVLDLANEGYLVRIKSKGTIVRQRDVSFGYQRQGSFSAMSQALGTVELKNKVLEAALTVPPEEVKEALGLPDGEEAFYLRRLRSIGETPSVYVEDWVDCRQCRGIDCIDFNRATLFQSMENIFGVRLENMVRTFEGCFPGKEEVIRELNVHKNTPLLKCTNTVYGNGGAPLVYSVALISGRYTVGE